MDIQLNVEQEILYGFAGKELVDVYENPDRNAKILKSYPYGRILKYRAFIS